jgi:hypothetical protein
VRSDTLMLIRSSFSLLLLLGSSVFFSLCRLATAQDAQTKVDLDRANTLLAQGNFNDAIALYDDVIRTYAFE